jgi:hypothetical protein
MKKSLRHLPKIFLTRSLDLGERSAFLSFENNNIEERLKLYFGSVSRNIFFFYIYIDSETRFDQSIFVSTQEGSRTQWIGKPEKKYKRDQII